MRGVINGPGDEANKTNMQFTMLTAIHLSDCVHVSSFNRLNETTQARLGSNLVFECSITVETVGSTVFLGGILDCNSSSNEIILIHSRFNMSTGTSKTCNNGKVVGYSLPVYNSNNCYTSLLRITVTQDMIGKSITCVYDNGRTTKEIGSFSMEEIQCYTTTVTTITPSTGKLLIHAGLFSK